MKANHALAIGLSAVLPGCGHIAMGHPGRGLLIFFLFGFAVDGVIYGHVNSFLPPQHAATTTYTLALVAGILLWVIAVADATRLVRRERRAETQADLATAHVRRALVAYLAEDLRAAVAALGDALRIDPRDPDALFYLGVVHAHAGQRRQAQRALRRCLRHDLDEKWEREIHAQLRALDAAPPKPPEPEPPPSTQPPADDGEPEADGSENPPQPPCQETPLEAQS